MFDLLINFFDKFQNELSDKISAGCVGFYLYCIKFVLRGGKLN